MAKGSTRSATAAMPVTSGQRFDCCSFLLCSADVSADIEYASGKSVSAVPLQKGWNPIQATLLTFTGATIVAHYN